MSKDPTQETMTENGAPAATKPKKRKPAAKAAAKATPGLEALQKEITELKAKIREGEEAALSRVCKAMGVDPVAVQVKEAEAPKPEGMIRCFVGYPVNINGKIYRGHVVVPHSVFCVIQEALGKRRQRLLSETIGNNWLLVELQQGMGYAPRLVGQVGMNGEVMSGSEVVING